MTFLANGTRNEGQLGRICQTDSVKTHNLEANHLPLSLYHHHLAMFITVRFDKDLLKI